MSAYVKQILKKNDGRGWGNPFREDVLHMCIKFWCDGFQMLMYFYIIIPYIIVCISCILCQSIWLVFSKRTWELGVCEIAHFLWFSIRFSLRFIISNGLKDHCFPRRKRRHCFDKFTSIRKFYPSFFFYRNWLQFTHVRLERNLRNLNHDVASYKIKNKRIILMFKAVIDALFSV